ncbi:hypothetical protein ACF0H5_009949 [Mactra antiquata]
MSFQCSNVNVLLAIVVYSNFLDYLLLTTVVPIIPQYLVEVDTEQALKEQEENVTELFLNETDVFIHINDSIIDINPADAKSERFLETILHIPVRAISENSKVGWLLGSKAIVQMVANPVVGFLSNRVSYRHLLLFGISVFLVSSAVFAAAESYVLLLIARASQGIGSAATLIAGMSMIAENYLDDKERSRAMGIAMGGLSLGILVGYPFGGFMYAFCGKSVPFVVIGALCALNIGLQIQCLDPDSGLNRVEMKSSSLIKLLVDPYIMICAGAIMVTSMSLAVLESTVPLWIIDTMKAKQWHLALIFLPDSIGYLIGTCCFAVIAKKYGRWIFTIGSLFSIGIGTLVIPFCRHLGHLLIPHLALGLGVGVTDAALVPLLALLVDQRHISTYGSVYSIVQLAVCLAYSLGPAVAGNVVKAVGFEWSMWSIAIINLAYVPLCVFLKSPPVDNETKGLLDEMASPDDIKNDMNKQLYQTISTDHGKLINKQ